MVVLGLVATAGILSLHGVVGGERGSKVDNLEMPLRIAQLDHQAALPKLWPDEALDDLGCDDSGLLVFRGSLARLAGERRPLQAAGTVTQVAVGQGGQGLAPTGRQVTAPIDVGGLTVVGQRLTVSVTVYGCLNDGTGAYACQPGAKAGACGYVLNPGVVGPGVTEPSAFIAAGPSWPCGTEFMFVETGQVVTVGDRGGLVHDYHADAWCYDGANRAACLPGIGPSAVVEVIYVPD
jgi:hypothetical protein